MPPLRPTRIPPVLVVFGIFNLVAGCFQWIYHCSANGCCLAFLGFFEVFGNKHGIGRLGQDTLAMLDQYIPGVFWYWTAGILVWTILGTAIFVAGIGLFSARRWARFTCLAWAPSTIFFNLVSLVYLFAVYHPGWVAYMKEAQIRNPQAQQQKAEAWPDNPVVTNFGAIVVAAASIFYAAALGIYMMSPAVVAACQAAASSNGSTAITRSYFDEDHF